MGLLTKGQLAGGRILASFPSHLMKYAETWVLPDSRCPTGALDTRCLFHWPLLIWLNPWPIMKLWKSSLSSQDNGFYFSGKKMCYRKNLEIHFLPIVLISSDIKDQKNVSNSYKDQFVYIPTNHSCWPLVPDGQQLSLSAGCPLWPPPQGSAVYSV